jgi:hypothetical protein
MDELTTGPRRSLDRPIHGACVVAGCWCRTPVAPEQPEPSRRSRLAARASARRSLPDLTAWRSVGLPVA